MVRIHQRQSQYAVYRRQSFAMGRHRHERAEQIRSALLFQDEAEVGLMRRLLLLIFSITLFAGRLEAQSDFYKGKQMKIVVGASAGAASDLYARVVAQHLPKQIAGKPDVIVQN